MEQKELDERIKTKFEELYIKQLKIARWILLTTFGLLGLMFLIAGIVCMSLGVVDSDGFAPSIFFLAFGAFMFLFGVIMFIAVSKTKIDYNKFIKRINKYGASALLLSAIVDVQKEQIAELEERIESLEKKIN